MHSVDSPNRIIYSHLKQYFLSNEWAKKLFKNIPTLSALNKKQSPLPSPENELNKHEMESIKPLKMKAICKNVS